MKNSRLTIVALGLLILALTPSVFAQAPVPTPAPQLNSDLRTVASLIKIGEYQRALSYLDYMRKTYGDDPRITAQYKQVYKEAKLYPQLEELVRAQLSRDASDPLLLTELAEARFLQKDEHGADSLWNIAIAVGEQNEASYRYVAEDKLRYGLYDDAIDVYLQGRRNLAKPALFSMELASIYEAQRDYPKAVDEYLNDLLDSEDKLGFVSTRIRGLVEDAESRDDITKTIKSKIDESPSRTNLYEILGDIYIKAGQMDKALECYRNIGARQKDDGQSLVRFAARALDSRAYSTAINAVDDYFQTSQKAAMKDQASLIKARAQYASGMVDESLENFKSLSLMSPDYRIREEASFTRGLIYAHDKGNCDSALIVWGALLNSARTQNVADEAMVEMAICFLRSDQPARAETLLTRAASGKMPNDDSEKAAFLLADMAFYGGDFKKADEMFRGLVRQYPQGPHSNDALIRIDVISLIGDDEGSRKYLLRFAEAMKAQDLDDQLGAASILSDSQFVGSAIEEQALFYAAGSYYRAGKNGDAIGKFKEYVEKFPDGFYVDRAYLALGDIYMQDPDTYPQAKSAYSKILEAYPEGPVTELARERLQQLETAGKIG